MHQAHRNNSPGVLALEVGGVHAAQHQLAAHVALILHMHNWGEHAMHVMRCGELGRNAAWARQLPSTSSPSNAASSCSKRAVQHGKQLRLLHVRLNLLWCRRQQQTACTATSHKAVELEGEGRLRQQHGSGQQLELETGACTVCTDKPLLALRLSQKEKTGSGSSPWASMFWKGGCTLPTEISGKPMPCNLGWSTSQVKLPVSSWRQVPESRIGL